MPKLYDGYCYSTVIESCSAYSTGYTIESTSDYLFFPNGFTDTGDGEGCMINFIRRNAATNVQNSLSQYVSFPDCETVGPINNNSGLSVSDVIEASWLVVLSLVMAYSVKIMRRTL